MNSCQFNIIRTFYINHRIENRYMIFGTDQNFDYNEDKFITPPMNCLITFCHCTLTKNIQLSRYQLHISQPQ